MTAASSTASYTVMARRFRPQAFGELVGQEHIAQALRNAIRSNRVAHAYLFTGARGVGKTSSARILAKALNCPTAVDGDPCNECEICQGISAGNDVDVIEIDGASNRSIDDIRQLRANVNVKSMRTKFKVYIIDEVHMLTKDAFNALLKTLEEPPPNVKFIFCTTEVNKVPDTILSRCQRFDFGTIATGNIKLRLSQIAEAEGVDVDDAALDLVARRAAGSMRDSQSIFDQLLAFGEEHVTATDVHRLLGTASDDLLTAIVEPLIARQQAGALTAFHAALDNGVQLGELTDQLLFYFRDLMVLATGAESLDLLAVASSSRATLIQQAKRWGLQTIVAAMQILGDTKGRMARVTYGRALAELALVRISMLENMASLDSLIAQLKQTEPAGALLTGPAPSEPEKKNDLALNSAPAVPLLTSPAPTPAVATREVTRTVSEAVPAPAAAPKSSLVAESTPPVATVPNSTAAPTAPVTPVIETTSPPGETPVAEVTPSTESGGSAASAVLQVLADPQAFWQQVLAEFTDLVKSHAKTVAKVTVIGANKLELAFPNRNQFSKKYCERLDVLKRLEETASRVAGQPLRLVLTSIDDGTPAAQQAPAAVAADANRTRRRVFKPEDDPFVTAVMTAFEAQVVKVEPVGSSANRDDDPSDE